MTQRAGIAPTSRRRRAGALVLVMALAGAGAAEAQHGVNGEWRVHGGDAGFTRYAALDQIDADTVGDLRVAWRREAVDASLRERWPELRYSNQLRSTPIMVGGVLYASNGIGLVEAFDPGTGETLWVQDAAFLGDDTPRGAPNRGVGWWESGADRRIFAIRPPYLMAVDPATGRLIETFGDGGLVDLRYDAETGYYVFDRVTGEPVWPIVERPVPGSNTPGEWIAPTQPFPTKPLPFDRHGIGIDDLIDFTPELRAEAIEIVEPYVLGEIFTPPSVRGDGPADTKGTLQLPGSVGGAEWGGAGFDPETGMLYVPSVTGAFAADLTPGNPDRMNVRYTRGTRAFPDGPRGLPLTKPPYGRITAIDMNSGEHVWMVPNGDGPRDHPAIAHLDLPPLGQPGRSMTLLTRTLLFVSEGDPIMVRTPPGAGPDAGRKFRAFDKESGRVVWETEFPAGTNGSPITYLHEGRQYVVLPIGSLRHPGEWVALALP